MLYLTNERLKLLKDFAKPLGLKFRHWEILDLAFHHRSLTNEDESFPYNNERLEFLGDSVLGLASAAFLYERYRENKEGDLAKIKSVVVSEKTLASIALRFHIDEMLLLGHGEEKSGGRKKDAILADCMEAIIGAYFLDAGWKEAEKYVLSFLIPEIEKVHDNRGMKDYKTLLQELYQKKAKSVPRYETVYIAGPDHAKRFSVIVHLGEKKFGPETGRNKKEAEQKAAQKAYEILTEK